jgi:H+/Cl- antiporter ClcA
MAIPASLGDSRPRPDRMTAFGLMEARPSPAKPSVLSSLTGVGRWALWLLGTLSLLAWLHDVVTSKHHHPLNYWLLVTMAFLLVAVFLWGWRRSPEAGGSPEVTHVYNAP